MYSRCWEDSYIPFSQQKWNCSRRLKTKVWSCLPLLPPCHRSLYFWPIAWELTPQASINTTSFLLSPLWPFHLSPVFNWTSSLARRWTRCSAVVWIESEDAGPCLARAFCKRSITASGLIFIAAFRTVRVLRSRDTGSMKRWMATLLLKRLQSHWRFPSLVCLKWNKKGGDCGAHGLRSFSGRFRNVSDEMSFFLDCLTPVSLSVVWIFSWSALGSLQQVDGAVFRREAAVSLKR